MRIARYLISAMVVFVWLPYKMYCSRTDGPPNSTVMEEVSAPNPGESQPIRPRVRLLNVASDVLGMKPADLLKKGPGPLRSYPDSAE